jgi:hypothetical protein
MAAAPGSRILVGSGVAAFAYAQSAKRPKLNLSVRLFFDVAPLPSSGEREPQQAARASPLRARRIGV